MAYIAYPIAKAHPPYGDIYHHQVPVIVTTVAELEDTLQRPRQEWGCEDHNDTDTMTLTLGPTQCGLWLETEVLLDTLAQSADEMVDRFDLRSAWLWDWANDFHGDTSPDEAALQAPCQVR